MPSGVNLHAPRRPLSVRFWEKVNKFGPVPPHSPELGPCWLWTASTDGTGRGQITVPGLRGPQKAPRVAWFLETGEWPRLFVCHHCDIPSCVRFSHFFEGTAKDNYDDALQKGRLESSRANLGANHRTLTQAQAEEIRRLYATREWSQRALAAKFKTPQPNIGKIVRGISWNDDGSASNLVIPYRLAPEQIQQVRELYASGQHSQAELALRRRESWRGKEVSIATATIASISD